MAPDTELIDARLRHGVALEGVRVVALEPQVDDRGSFIEIFADDWSLDIAPAQWSLVHSRAGTLRGMHLHRRHDELFTVVSGRAHVGLHDLRQQSPTAGRAALYALNDEAPCALVFPPGIVHGWLYETDTVHLQATSESYRTYGHDDNEGCHWSDPELGIEWPNSPTRISDRADAFGSLIDLRSAL